MSHGRFHGSAGSRTKVVALLIPLLIGLLFVAVLISPVFAASGVVSLPALVDGFAQIEFSNVAGTRMQGQTFSIDVELETPLHVEKGHVWSEVFLQTEPHANANANADYPYSQYVVFEPGSSAYATDQNGKLLDAPMTDWKEGLTDSPGPTLGAVMTDRGWAGADMIVYPANGKKVAGLHFDLVLPNTGQTLVLGRIAVQVVTKADQGQDQDKQTDSKSDDEKAATEVALTNQTTSEASINWKTDAVETVVQFGTSDSYGQHAAPEDNGSGDYSVDLDGLASNTTYHYRITSVDDSGNVESTEDRAFVTGFDVPGGGGSLRVTDGKGQMVAGYGRVQLRSGVSPSGLAIFGNRQAGVLANELAVPATTLVTSGRTFITVSPDGLTNTGIAMANPNSEDAAIHFDLRDESGNIYRSGSFTLKGINSPCDSEAICNHLSRFIDEDPFSSQRGIEGTLSFTSTAPISVVAIRSLYNERTPRDFLMSNQSVVDLSVSPSTGIQVIPQFAVGNGVTAQIVLMNPTGLELRGQVQFMDSTSSPVFIKTTDGSYTNTVHYALAPNGSVRFFLNEASVPTASGSVWVIPGDDSPTPVASALLSYKSGAFTTSETNVPATMGTAFTMYAQLSSSRRINTSVVVTNPTPHRGRITLTLTDLDGNFLGTASGVIDGGKQIRTSVDAIVPALRDREIQGVLRITTDLPSVSVAGFRERYNERAPAADLLISTMPPTSEDASTSQERIFPQLLNGDGFTTEIILYSGSDGATSQGQMIFIRPDGTPSTLDIH